MEGNFPPQILEALEYHTPVVSTRLPQITETLGSLSEELLLCRPLDLEEFCEKLESALADRSHALARQSRVTAALRQNSSAELFYASLDKMLAPFLGRSAIPTPARAA